MHAHAAQLMDNPNYRFSIREIGKGTLRKFMTSSLFLAKRGQYTDRPWGMRVDITNMKTGDVQTWDLSMTKRYWA